VLFERVIQTRKQVQGPDSLETLISMGNIASLYRKSGCDEEAVNLEATISILRQKGDTQMTTAEAVHIIRSCNEEVVALLLERNHTVPLTEEVVMAAAGKSFGEGIIKLLLSQRESEVQVTERIIIAAAGNFRSGDCIVRHLPKDKVLRIPITEGLVTTAAENFLSGHGVMEELLRGEAQITEAAVRELAKSFRGKFIEYLYREEDKIRIIEREVTAAAGNVSNREVVRLLLKQDANEAVVTKVGNITS